jgi:hypothetical protein
MELRETIEPQRGTKPCSIIAQSLARYFVWRRDMNSIGWLSSIMSVLRCDE